MLPEKTGKDSCSTDNSLKTGIYTIKRKPLGFGFQVSYLGISAEKAQQSPIVFPLNTESENTQIITLGAPDTMFSSSGDGTKYYRFIKIDRDDKSPNIIHAEATVRWENNQDKGEISIPTELANIDQ